MSAVTPYQPHLLPEGDFTDAEIDFMENEPPTIFPENQNSNWGYIIRKLFTDSIQELIDQQDTIYNNRFVDTSVDFLDEWEIQESVPVAPIGLDTATRQSIVLNRVRKGPFTRTMRRSIVETYIGATFGTPADFSPSGLVIDAGGIPMFAGSGTVLTSYEIVEDVPNYLYHVYLESGIAVAAGMLRELTRVTPAGISFDVTSVTNAPPRLYWKLNDVAGSTTIKDFSPLAHPGTKGSGITLGGSLIGDTAPTAIFNNTSNAVITSAYSPFVANSQRTFMGVGYRLSTTDGDTLFASAAGGLQLWVAAGSENVTFQVNGTPTAQTWTAAWPGVNQLVWWALTYNDSTKVAELFINGVSQGTKTEASGYSGATTFQVGTGSLGLPFNGRMRDVAVYERILSTAEILSYAHGFTLS